MSLRAIVFDFDGVIANSEPLHFRALRDVLAASGVDLSERDYYARYLGYDDAGALRAIAADRHLRWSADDVAALTDRKAVRLADLEAGEPLLFPGAAAAIDRAAGAAPIAIASGARRDEILRVLEHARLLDRFVAIVGAEDAAASKPAPDPYLRAVAAIADRTGERVPPGECVAIEDSRWGLVAARAAGLRTVAVTHTYAAAELRADADLVIDRLDALTIDALRALWSA